MSISRQAFGDRHAGGGTRAPDHRFVGANDFGDPEFRNRPFNWDADSSGSSLFSLSSSFGALNIDGSLADHPGHHHHRQQPPLHQHSANQATAGNNSAPPRRPPVSPHNDAYGGGVGNSRDFTNNFNPRTTVQPNTMRTEFYSTPNLGQSNGYGPTGFQNDQPEQSQRRRRFKYMPPMKTDAELFNDRNHIKPGDFWDEMFGAAKDENLTISCVDSGTQYNELVQHFADCNFSREIMLNIQLRKYSLPTQIQKSVIPFIQKHRGDVMAHAQTGTGKSAAFLLPIVNEIQRIKSAAANRAPNRESPLALIIVPTKELAEQLFTDGRSFSINTGVSVQRTYGDMFVRESKTNLQSGCDICIVTCGRLLHFVHEGIIKLNNLRFLVLDEADKLLSCTNFHQCVDEIKHHPNINPEHRVLMFSATFNNAVQGIAQQFLRHNYIFVNVGVLNSAVETVCQEFIEVHKFNKQERLLEILKKDAVPKTLPGGENYWLPAVKTLVFVEQKRQSDRLSIALSQEGFRVISVNSDRTLQQRHIAIAKFTHGAFDVLVSTDVAARGLNFPNVKHVINFDLPEQLDETYIHRIGRTGRAGNTGRATSFFDPSSPEDTAKADFYIRVLAQARLQIPEFLRRYATDDVY